MPTIRAMAREVLDMTTETLDQNWIKGYFAVIPDDDGLEDYCLVSSGEEVKTHSKFKGQEPVKMCLVGGIDHCVYVVETKYGLSYKKGWKLYRVVIDLVLQAIWAKMDEDEQDGRGSHVNVGIPDWNDDDARELPEVIDVLGIARTGADSLPADGNEPEWGKQLFAYSSENVAPNRRDWYADHKEAFTS